MTIIPPILRGDFVGVQEAAQPNEKKTLNPVIVQVIMTIVALFAPVVIQTDRYGAGTIVIISLIWSWKISGLNPGFLFTYMGSDAHLFGIIAFFSFAIVRVLFVFMVIRQIQGKVTAMRAIGFGVFTELLPAPFAPILVFPGTYIWIPVPFSLIIALILMRLSRQE